MRRPRTTAARLLALLCTSYLRLFANSKEALARADLIDALRTVLQPDGGGVHDEYSFAADEAALRCAGRPGERSPAFFAFRCALLQHSLRLASTVRTLCPSLALNLTRPSQQLRVFVYDLPPQFNLENYVNFTVWRDQAAHPHSASWNGNNIFESAAQHDFYAAEVRLHEALLWSPHRTMDPDDGGYVFLPACVGGRAPVAFRLGQRIGVAGLDSGRIPVLSVPLPETRSVEGGWSAQPHHGLHPRRWAYPVP